MERDVRILDSADRPDELIELVNRNRSAEEAESLECGFAFGA